MTYTHADYLTGHFPAWQQHAKACADAGKQLGEPYAVLQQWVQVKTSGSACCARILDAWSSPDGADFWKVQATQPLAFTGSFPVKAVRQCSGIDGRCVCAGEHGSAAEFDGFLTPAFSQAGVVAPPDSPNFRIFDHADVVGVSPAV